MALKRISDVYFLADTKSDLDSITHLQMGSECFVIEEACEYKITSDGKWINQNKVVSNSSTDGSNENCVTKEEMESAIAAIEIPSIEGLASEEFVENAINGIEIPSIDGLATREEVMKAVASVEIPSVEGLASESYVDEAIKNAGMFEDIYGEEHMFGLMVNARDNISLVDAIKDKGHGFYNFWIEKGSVGQPEEVIAKNSSCRGLACVDTVKPTGWYGWVIMFDHDGDMYTQYIRNGEAKGWKLKA